MNGDNFVVHLALIKHFHYANRFGAQNGKRQNRFLPQHQNIQRIVVVAVTLRDKPVIGRIMHGAVKNAVDLKQAAGLVQFVFDIRTAGNFDNRGYDFRSLFADPDTMPWM